MPKASERDDTDNGSGSSSAAVQAGDGGSSSELGTDAAQSGSDGNRRRPRRRRRRRKSTKDSDDNSDRRAVEDAHAKRQGPAHAHAQSGDDKAGADRNVKGDDVKRASSEEESLSMPGQGHPHIVDSLQLLLSEPYLGGAWNALLGLLDPQGAGWQRARQAERQRFFLVARDAPVLVPFRVAAIGAAVSRPTTANLEGDAVQADGRLRESTVTQSTAEAGHVLSWGWRLQD